MASESSEYILGKSKDEIERLTTQHQWLKNNTKRLIIASVDLTKPHLRVLDSGCADGLWLREIRNELAAPDTSTLVGTDVEESFFPDPENAHGIRFQKHSVCDVWPEQMLSSFDLTHQRYVLYGIGKSTSPQQAVHNLVSTVAPGGWIQLEEMDIRHETYATMPKATQDMMAACRSLFTVSASGAEVSSKLDGWLEREGLRHVERRAFPLRIGREDPDPGGAGRLALDSWKHSAAVVSGVLQNLDTGLDPSILKDLPERIDRELTDQGASLILFVSIGQKPPLVVDG